MKSYHLHIYSILIVVLISNCLWAQRFFGSLYPTLPEISSARQLALGFSSWGSAGQPSAVKSNPALIGLSEYKLVLIADGGGKFGDEKRSFPVQDSFGDFLADNIYVINKSALYSFDAGLLYRLNARLSLAADYSRCRPYDYSYNEEVRGSVYGYYNRDPLVGYHRMSSGSLVNQYSLGIAFSIFKQLQLGAALQYRHFSDTEELYEVEVLRQSDNLISDQTISYQYAVELEPLWNVQAGVLIQATKHLQLAFAFRPGQVCKYRDKLFHWLNDTTALLPDLRADTTHSVTAADYRFPQNFSIGLCYRPQNIVPTSFFIEAQYENWEDFEIDYQFEDEASPEFENILSRDFRFENVWKIHVGIEHTFFTGVPFRMGFFHDPSPIHASLNRNWISAGTGYRWDRLHLDVSMAFTKGEYRYPDLFPIPGEVRVEHDTVREVFILGRLSLTYLFQ